MSNSLTPRTLLLLSLLGVSLVKPAAADTLTTTFASGNGQSGNMFDLTVSSPLTITSLAVHVTDTAASIPLAVYYKSGSYVGSEDNVPAWTFQGNYTFTGAGFGFGSFVDISDLALGNGTFGMAIFRTDAGTLNYTNGNGSNQSYSSGPLLLSAGIGKGQFSGVAGSGTENFGETFNPRVWNGQINFTVGAGTAPEPGTLALVALGVVGGMIARRRRL